MACDMKIEGLYILCVSLFVSTEISFIVGSITHVFIIAVYVIDWRKRRTMSTSDQVIISIMISRMILQSVIQLNLFWELFCTISRLYDMVIQIIVCSFMYSSFLLSTLLGVVFYVKISNFHSAFFLWLRRIISTGILHFIITSLLVSISQTTATFLVYFAPYNTFISINSSQTTQPNDDVIYVVFFLSIFGPLLISLLSSLFLITSLYLHIKHMRCSRNVTGSLDPYYRIIKYITGSIFTSVLCVIITVVQEYFNIFGFVSFSFPWTVFETIHSILLIYATPKLKNPLSGILMYLSNFWIKREEPENILMTVTT